jgi:hypothetical protein
VGARSIRFSHTTEVQMKRWHEEYNVFYRQWKIHRKSHVDSNKDSSRNRIGKDPYEVDCECDEQVGRFRKKDAWDCGNVRCYLCHSDKFPKRQLTNKEVRSNISLKEQKNDYKSSIR